MNEWIDQYRTLLGWLGFGSLALCIASAVLAPLWIIRLPPDFLLRLRQEHQPVFGRGLLRTLAAIGKNLLGLMLIIAGVLMLLLPGQGILAIFIGVLLLDCPGKHRLVEWVATRPVVWRSINWLRRRAGKPPFILAPVRAAKSSPATHDVNQKNSSV